MFSYPHTSRWQEVSQWWGIRPSTTHPLKTLKRPSISWINICFTAVSEGKLSKQMTNHEKKGIIRDSQCWENEADMYSHSHSCWLMQYEGTPATFLILLPPVILPVSWEAVGSQKQPRDLEVADSGYSLMLTRHLNLQLHCCYYNSERQSH